MRASAPARVVSMMVAVHRVAGSNPPTDKGIFCDSAHIRPVVAIPETPTAGATQKPPGISNGLQREPLPRIVTKGV